ncbi:MULTISPECIES: ABC transporter substrate-binding protein [Streptomyces]|uniref:ABC transporter substrate-binding protein n=2 Tax=Streptomyces TaxID=1883 RepID=A0A420UY83_9ACTN|nr:MULTISPECIES: ABC transporter substrate-binding protein [Streptomyces]KNE81991.1 ABC transporter substrate-binding protein [Streptomyces fradiae]OFA51446.1 ABC transporter substrate-binding protein [Streptomyces fradiae]PQM19447.1 ABC transporter substrate-binding protein [Streptomyces xinghaiensis]RKM92786.1 ABC transporter substrate-binding protein [Streptomyces xinghaiensis]RNC69129.1 ABC transporter substrate-binding protein [Streptomyces xinghaiensis]
MSGNRPASPSRRGLLAATGALGLSVLLAACGGDSGSSSGADDSKSKPWSFTDDRKKKATADSTPERIVAFTGTAAALADFGLKDKIVGVFGETTLKDGSAHPQAGDLDVKKVEVLGNAWGEFDIEKYAALNPDLLVTHQYDKGSLWYVPEESADKILKVAPSVATQVANVSLTEPIERYAELAESLGADLKSPQVTEGKERFEKAAEKLRKAAKANGGLKVMAASGSADYFYVSTPGPAADLKYFEELGVEFVTPKDVKESGGYFESLSWENADKYDADLIILDNRSTALQAKDLESKPTWKKLAAVEAGQVAEWDPVPRFSYQGAAPLLEDLAEAIDESEKLD